MTGLLPRFYLFEYRILSDDLFGWDTFDVAFLVAYDNGLIMTIVYYTLFLTPYVLSE